MYLIIVSSPFIEGSEEKKMGGDKEVRRDGMERERRRRVFLGKCYGTLFNVPGMVNGMMIHGRLATGK